MKKKVLHRNIQQLIEEQVSTWQMRVFDRPKGKKGKPVVTVSREAGSGGKIVAHKVAEILSFTVFNQQIIDSIAQDANMSTEVIKTLDERQHKVMNNWISAFFTDRYLWPDEYLKHLARVIYAIGQQGDAVILGRGANFIIPSEDCFRIRVVAPLDKRIAALSKKYNMWEDDAEKFIRRTEADRKAFVYQHFNADISDPANYDLVINTGDLSFDDAAQMVKAAIKIRFKFKRD